MLSCEDTRYADYIFTQPISGQEWVQEQAVSWQLHCDPGSLGYCFGWLTFPGDGYRALVHLPLGGATQIAQVAAELRTLMHRWRVGEPHTAD